MELIHFRQVCMFSSTPARLEAQPNDPAADLTDCGWQSELQLART